MPAPLRHATAAALAVGLAAAATADPAQWGAEWPETDFSKTTLESWEEVISGGPPKDGIPALSAPDFLAVEAEDRIGAREPVIAVEIEGATPRAYPIRYLMWHEIVNDSVAGRPVAVTYCPLCNSGITFDRSVGDKVLTFGVSGKLRHSDMIMYDRETESWWQQALGEAIVGEMTGTDLETLPTWMEGWAQFAARNPDGIVMDEPEWNRSYGANPYRDYDSADRPFLYSGENPPHGLRPLERVVRVGEHAWPLARLAEQEVIREAGVVLTWRPGQASALDADRIAEGRDVGSVRVRDGRGRDVTHDVMFAFTFDAFWPEGTWMLDGGPR